MLREAKRVIVRAWRAYLHVHQVKRPPSVAPGSLWAAEPHLVGVHMTLQSRLQLERAGTLPVGQSAAKSAAHSSGMLTSSPYLVGSQRKAC